MKKNFIDLAAIIAHHENVLSVCDKMIQCLTHPELYGCSLSKCNTIVINQERMMCVTTGINNLTTYEFSPLYPTYFSPEAADRIVCHVIFKDCNGNRINLVKMGKLGYYRLLKEYTERNLAALKSVIA